MAKFSPTKTKLSQTEFLTNKGINSYLFTEGALDFSPTKRNLPSILEISHQPAGLPFDGKSSSKRIITSQIGHDVIGGNFSVIRIFLFK